MSRRVDLGQVVPIKGQDYFTTAEIEQIESETKEQVKTELDFDNTISRIDSDIQDLNTNKASKTELESETSARELADTNLQGQIDAITSSKDVVDIVGTYQDLMNYDTTSLTEDDVIKVLDDSTHNDAMSYYRWSNNTWNYVGSEGPFYTRSETDERLNTKQPTIDSTHKLSSDLVDDTNQTNKFTSTNEKNTWNAKYDKPNTGIPKSDLVASVQESLDKADTAIQDVSDKEDKSNKVTEINSSSTDTQYPSAKCVYDSQQEQNEQIAELEMLYNAFPTVSDEDTTIQLDNTAKVKFREIDLKGNTSQVVIPEEQGTSVSNTSISISDVNTDKEHTIEMSGNTYQETTTGKNLANFINTEPYLYTSGIPTTVITSTTISNKTNNGYTVTYGTNSFIGALSNEMEFEENTNYVFSFRRTQNSNFTQKMHILQVNNDNSYTLLQAINAGVYGTPYTYTYSNTTAKKVAFMISTNNSNPKDETETISEIMVRKSTASDAYEPYTYGASPNPDYPQNIEVVTGTQNVFINGKNIFNKTDYTTFGTTLNRNGNAKFTTDTNKITITTGASSANSGVYIRPITDYIDNYKSNREYMVSFDIKASQELTFKYGMSATANDHIVTIGTTTTRLSVKETLSGSSGFVLYSTQNRANDTIEISNIMVSLVDDTTFEPYHTNQVLPINLGNIELCKIGDYKDYFYKYSGKWYLNKQIGKVVLDGSENNWGIASSLRPTFFLNTFNDKVSGTSNFICDKFSYKGNAQQQTLGYAMSFNIDTFSNFMYIQVPSNIVPIQDVVSFKVWLSNNITTVRYPLATPTTTEITDTTLVNQLNALYNATIYPITNINTDTSNLLPYIDLHYNFVTPSPSPSRPSVVNVVKGNNTITISNSDNTESQNYPINLGDMELCKIDTYQDYIYESNGNWFKKENIKVATDIVGSTSKTISDMVSNATVYSYCGGTVSGTTITYTSELLVENKIYYPTTTPTDTQITDTTLITQLNNIKKAYSYDTQTNISQTNTDKPFIIYAEAIRSLKDVFE